MDIRRSLILAVLIGGGCGVNLHPDVGRQAGVSPRGEVATSHVARGVPDTIGYGTFTAFAIPVAPVRITNGAGNQLVMQAVRSALEAAGYRVVDAGSDHGRALECRVTRFSFKNYTWLAPVVFTWGGIDLELEVLDANGHPVWQRAYTGKSTNLSYSFEGAVNTSLRKIVDKAVADFQDSAFHNACCGTEAAAAPPAAL